MQYNSVAKVMSKKLHEIINMFHDGTIVGGGLSDSVLTIDIECEYKQSEFTEKPANFFRIICSPVYDVHVTYDFQGKILTENASAISTPQNTEEAVTALNSQELEILSAETVSTNTNQTDGKDSVKIIALRDFWEPEKITGVHTQIEITLDSVKTECVLQAHGDFSLNGFVEIK